MQYDEFKNVKSLAAQMGPMQVKDLKMSDIKVVKFEKKKPTTISVKYSYSEEFKDFQLFKKGKSATTLLPCYPNRLPLSENKRKDLAELCEKNMIPRPYSDFFNKIISIV